MPLSNGAQLVLFVLQLACRIQPHSRLHPKCAVKLVCFFNDTLISFHNYEERSDEVSSSYIW